MSEQPPTVVYIRNLRQVWLPYVFILGRGRLETSARFFTRSPLYGVRRYKMQVYQIPHIHYAFAACNQVHIVHMCTQFQVLCTHIEHEVRKQRNHTSHWNTPIEPMHKPHYIRILKRFNSP